MFSDDHPTNSYYPEVLSVEVIATQPTVADLRNIEYMRSAGHPQIENITYIVRLNLNSLPEISSLGFRVYVGEFRVLKYSECPSGIYFKVYDPDFFSEHANQDIRFSIDDVTFQDSGQTLPAVNDLSLLTLAEDEMNLLPTQKQVLGF